MICAAVTVSGYSLVTSMSRVCVADARLVEQALGLVDVVAVRSYGVYQGLPLGIASWLAVAVP